MPIMTNPFDPADYLTDEESRAEYLRLSFESGDAAEIAEGLGTVARALGMSRIATDAHLSRPALYRALARDGNPSLDTILRVIKALDLQLTVRPAQRQSEPAS
ncbi:putative addiction module antidote protein [Roseicella sp. DB1501]|nr:putative addiction module antidote protein [Roseicella sp. DB1501]